MKGRKSRGHVAIIASNFWPECTGISQVVTEFADYVSEAGIEVRVATAMPYYPEWSIYQGYRGALWRREVRNGVQILRAWHFVRPSPSAFARLLHEATLSIFALPTIIRTLSGARAAYITSPDLSYAFTASVAARLLGVRRVLMVQDLMPDAAVELGMLRSKTVIAISRWLARRLYALADEIYTLGEGMRRRIGRETKDPEKIMIVPNTIDPSELEPVPYEQNAFRQTFVEPGVFAVLHTGNMGNKQDLHLLLRAAQRLISDESVRFFVFGDGAMRQEFLSARDRMGLVNVSHHPLQERWMLRHMLSGADVVLVSQLPQVVDIVVPSKLLTALAAGAMVVAACHPDSETARLVLESGGGIVIPPSDPLALVTALEDIKNGRVDVAACRNRARLFALREFDREAVYGPVAKSLGGEGEETAARFATSSAAGLT